MPRTKSAKKQMRQARNATTRNRGQRSALRTAVKKLRSSIDDPKENKAAFLEAERQLDRAARKGLLHRNTAARQKSRMAKRMRKGA